MHFDPKTGTWSGMGPEAAANAGGPPMSYSGRGIGFRRDGGQSGGEIPEGPDYYQRAFANNSPFAVPSSTNWQTQLSPEEEKVFDNWVRQKHVPFDPAAKTADYDMRGYWQSGAGGDWQQEQHFPDTYKTPYDTTFSNESKYAQPGTPFRWQGDTLQDSRTGSPVQYGPGQTGGPTQIGGVAPPTGTGPGGVGLTPGGSIDTALGVAAMAVPGLGQAAQTGIKEANRAIQFAGQAAGIGVQGLMETFLPMGVSELANKNWFTRFVGGLAGAAPALPNIAGKSPAAPQPQGGQGQQQGGNTNIFNNTVNNTGATEEQNAKALTHHQTIQYGG